MSADPAHPGGKVVVVLVQPLHPGNVGASARAMRNFGLEDLVIVDPPAYDPERARWMAPGCADLLANARIAGSLDDALVGVHRVFGTTARHRRLGHPVIEPPEAAERVAADPDDRVTAILFGREDSGLSNAEVGRCEALVRIATPEHASLNLAQSVLLLAHHLFDARRRRGLPARGRTLGGSRRKGKTTAEARPHGAKERPADVADLEPAVASLVALLGRVGYLKSTSPEKVHATATQALQRASLSVRHVEALRGMVNRLDWALDHPAAPAGDGRDPGEPG